MTESHHDDTHEGAGAHVEQGGGDFNISGHIVICNWSDKADKIIKQLHDPSVANKKPIIVVTQDPDQVPNSSDDPNYRGVLIVHGDPADKEILKRADVGTAYAAVILADSENPDQSDSRSILVQLAVDAVNSETHTIVELVHSSSETYFRYTNANELVCLEMLAEKILSQASLTPNVSKVYMDLLTQSACTNEIYDEHLPDYMDGLTYRQIDDMMAETKDADLLLIGYSRFDCKKDEHGECLVDPHGRKIPDRRIVINPHREALGEDHVGRKMRAGEDGDTLYIIAYAQPNLRALMPPKKVEAVRKAGRAGGPGAAYAK